MAFEDFKLFDKFKIKVYVEQSSTSRYFLLITPYSTGLLVFCDVN